MAVEGGSQVLAYLIEAHDMATPVLRALETNVAAMTKQVRTSLADIQKSMLAVNTEQAKLTAGTKLEAAEQTKATVVTGKQAEANKLLAAETAAAAAATAKQDVAQKGAVASASALSASHGGVAGASAAAAAAHDSHASSLTNLGQTMHQHGQTTANLGSELTRLTVPLAAISAASLYTFMNFSGAMERLHTQAGYTQQSVNQLSPQILRMAPGIAQTPTAIADGLYHIASVGLPAGKALDVVKNAAIGANIGAANFEDVANLLATTLHNYPNVAQGAAGAMGQLNEIVGQGNIRMEDLATSLGQVIPGAKAAGLNLQDVGAAMDVMTRGGVTAEMAATRLRMGISLMLDPTAKATTALRQIGITHTQLATDMQSPQGLLKAMTDLKTHLDAAYPPGRALTIQQEQKDIDAYAASLRNAGVVGATYSKDVTAYYNSLKQGGSAAVQQAQLITSAFGGARSGAGILTLTQNLGELQQMYLKLPAGTAAVKQLSDAQASWDQTSQGQFDHLKAGLSTTAVELGQTLVPVVLPALKELAGGVEIVAKGFEGLPAPAKDAIIALLGVGVLAGPFIRVYGNLEKLGGSIVTLIGKLPIFATETAAAGTAAAAAAPEVEALGAAGRTAMLGIGPLILGLGGLVLAAEALKGPLGSLSQDIHQATGGALGTGFSAYSGPKGAITVAQAQVYAHHMASSGVVSYQAALANIMASGAVSGTAAAGGAPSTTTAISQIIGAGTKTLGSRQGFAQATLAQLGLPVTHANIANLMAWEQREGGGFGNVAAFNPLNTTQGAPGATSINQVGVKAYTSPLQGFQATLATLHGYPTVLAALRRGNLSVQQFADVVGGTPWGTPSTGWPGAPANATAPTGQGLVNPAPAAVKAPASSYHFDWQTHAYRNMTSAELKALETAWYRAHPHEPMPTSEAALMRALYPIGHGPYPASFSALSEGPRALAAGATALTAALRGAGTGVVTAAGASGAAGGPGTLGLDTSSVAQLRFLIGEARKTNNQQLIVGFQNDIKTVTRNLGGAIVQTVQANTGLGAPAAAQTGIAQLRTMIAAARKQHQTTLVDSLLKDVTAVTTAWDTSIKNNFQAGLSNVNLTEQLKITRQQLGGNPLATSATDPAYEQAQIKSYQNYMTQLTAALTTDQATLHGQMVLPKKQRDQALIDSTKTAIATINNDLLQANVDVAGIQEAFAQAVYQAFLTGIQATATALDQQSQNQATAQSILTSLGDAQGTSLSALQALSGQQGGLTAAQRLQAQQDLQNFIAGVQAQEQPITGGLTGSPLQSILGQLAGQIGASPGGLSQSQYAGYAGLFGPGSELGVDFGALASGKLSSTDQASMLQAVLQLAASLSSLEGTVTSQTNATNQLTGATLSVAATMTSFGGQVTFSLPGDSSGMSYVAGQSSVNTSHLGVGM